MHDVDRIHSLHCPPFDLCAGLPQQAGALQRGLCLLSSAVPLGALLPTGLAHHSCSSPAHLASLNAAVVRIWTPHRCRKDLDSTPIVACDVAFDIACQRPTSQAQPPEEKICSSLLMFAPRVSTTVANTAGAPPPPATQRQHCNMGCA